MHAPKTKAEAQQAIREAETKAARCDAVRRDSTRLEWVREGADADADSFRVEAKRLRTLLPSLPESP